MKVMIPTSWNDVTVNQYQLLNTLDRSDFKTDLQYSIRLVNLLCNIDSEDISLLDFNNIVSHLGFIQKPIDEIIKDKILIKGLSYEWVADLNSLSVGEMLSVEQIIDMEGLSYNHSIDVIAAILLRPKDEVFNSDLFQERRELFGDIPITELIGMVNFFSNGGRHSTQNIKVCSVELMMGKTMKMKRMKKTLWSITNGLVWLINLLNKILLKAILFTSKIIYQH
jgi:hypothetical protein